jgi:glycine/D-amino acid oxidase-like deaminating enzyme
MTMKYNYVVIGGGFFGCMIAQSLKGKVLLIEKDKDLMQKASANNQARVHNGYHYPRSIQTALASHVNFPRFMSEFKGAVSDDYTMFYAVGRNGKTDAKTYKKMCQEVGCPLYDAPENLKKWFSHEQIEEVFLGHEGVFDSEKLKQILIGKLAWKVDILTNTEVLKVSEGEVHLKDRIIKTDKIIACTYADTNKLLVDSGLPELPIRNEETVMPVVEVPEKFKNVAITIMDGAFFSIYPFPKYGLHTIHHVNYTPEGGDYSKIKEHVVSCIPEMKDMKHRGDIRERKTILLQNDVDDGRPIMFRKDYGFSGLDVIVGAKLDNIYDILDFEKLDDSRYIV